MEGETQKMQPSTGRILLYKLSQNDADCVNRRRVAKPQEPNWVAGAQAHVGNPAAEGQIVPMIVVTVFPN
jgi:hypothetical protein